KQNFKELQNVEQFKTMQLRIVPGCNLQLRLPECPREEPNPRLRVRSQLPVRSFVFLQEVVSADRTPRTTPVCGVSSNKEGHACVPALRTRKDALAASSRIKVTTIDSASKLGKASVGARGGT